MADKITPQNDSSSEFANLYSQTKKHSLVDIHRCWNIYELVKATNAIEGSIAEVGVYKGGTAFIISRACNGKPVHLFDTFTGMPESDPIIDYCKKGDFSNVSLKSVQDQIGFGNVQQHIGFFPDTAEPILGDKFSFVHIDCDIYRSVMDCCEFFYPRMVAGGIMLFDDYGFLTCKGAKLAVDQFFTGRNEHPIYINDGHCLIIKQF